jgi:hypothetical protein
MRATRLLHVASAPDSLHRCVPVRSCAWPCSLRSAGVAPTVYFIDAGHASSSDAMSACLRQVRSLTALSDRAAMPCCNLVNLLQHSTTSCNIPACSDRSTACAKLKPTRSPNPKQYDCAPIRSLTSLLHRRALYSAAGGLSLRGRVRCADPQRCLQCVDEFVQKHSSR